MAKRGSQQQTKVEELQENSHLGRATIELLTKYQVQQDTLGWKGSDTEWKANRVLLRSRQRDRQGGTEGQGIRHDEETLAVRESEYHLRNARDQLHTAGTIQPYATGTIRYTNGGPEPAGRESDRTRYQQHFLIRLPFPRTRREQLHARQYPYDQLYGTTGNVVIYQDQQIYTMAEHQSFQIDPVPTTQHTA